MRLPAPFDYRDMRLSLEHQESVGFIVAAYLHRDVNANVASDKKKKKKTKKERKKGKATWDMYVARKKRPRERDREREQRDEEK